MKIDGRTLRSDIKRYLKAKHPEHADAAFTVRSLEKTHNYRTSYELEVRFSEIDYSARSVHSDVAEWVTRHWWPHNRGKVLMAHKVWDGLYRPHVSRTVPVDKVTVGLYGWLHDGS